MLPRSLPALDPPAYAVAIQGTNPADMLWAFVGQILAFQAVFTREYAHILQHVPQADLFADLLGGINACVTDRLTITAEQYLAHDSTTLFDHYTAQWPEKDRRLIAPGVCNATYRVIAVSLSGYLAIYHRLCPTVMEEVFLPLRSAHTAVMHVFTLTQCAIQQKPGYIEDVHWDEHEEE